MNRYIIRTTYYITKRVEARVVKNNTTKWTAEFYFEEIITKFGCPLEFVSNQGGHFMNDIIGISHVLPSSKRIGCEYKQSHQDSFDENGQCRSYQLEHQVACSLMGLLNSL